MSTILDLDALEARSDALAAVYRSADPFPHVVIDDLLPNATLSAVYDELGELSGSDWNSYLHVNERKFSNTDIDEWGPTTRAVAEVFASPRFVELLERITGIDGLQADLTLDGGGIHRSYRGGHLNVHADFTAHHTVPNWRRRVNLLLYLNPRWEASWGGDLELWDREMTRAVRTVAPVGNRVLLFTTDEHSFHGHPEPLCSPDGVARQSLALYYFTDDENPLVRSTDYRARPDDGLRRFAIRADTRALAVYDSIKRRFRVSDDAVRRVMGLFSRRRT